MSRRFTLVTVVLTAVVAFLVGAVLPGGLLGSVCARTGAKKRRCPMLRRGRRGAVAAASLVNFADVVERINPAVVNIDATTKGSETRVRLAVDCGDACRSRRSCSTGPFGRHSRADDRDAPRRGVGASCIDPDGALTNSRRASWARPSRQRRRRSPRTLAPLGRRIDVDDCRMDPLDDVGEVDERCGRHAPDGRAAAWTSTLFAPVRAATEARGSRL